MARFTLDERGRRRVLLVANIAVRLAIVYWLAEAWILQDDPRFAGKAIPERNTVIVGGLSLLFPAIWWRRRLDWARYPLGIDIVYLSIFALDMAGNSFDLYEGYRYFDLIPHLHSPGAASLVVATWWARSRHDATSTAVGRRWLLETTLVAASVATVIHVVLEAQEYYTDVLAGTINVGGVADTVNDLTVGLVGSVVYPLLALRWFLPGPRPRVGWRSAVTGAALVAFAVVVMTEPGPRVADVLADRFATGVDSGGLTEPQFAGLIEQAARTASAPPSPGASARHAHDSVTLQQMQEALTGGYASIEGDVGLVGALPVLRHDPRDPVGMTFLEWLEVVVVADFETVKVDVKRDRIGPIVDDLRTAISEFGLAEERLKLNADVLEGPRAYADLSLQERFYTRVALKMEPADLVALARAFPAAAVSIGAWSGPVADGVTYDAVNADAVLAVAAAIREVGTRRVAAAARWDLLSDEFVETMRVAGIAVDVWNSLTIASPDDPAAESERLRSRYGDALGVIDLRR